MSSNHLNKLRIVALGLGLGLGSVALAQETPPPATAADGLSMGSEQKPADGPGTTYTAATFDDWQQRCVKTEDGSDPCQMYQLLKDGEGNSVAEISMFALPDGQKAAAGATVIAPLETLLTANISLKVDATQPKVYPFSWCNRLGCYSRVGFTQAEVDGLKKGSKAVITIVPAAAPTQKVALNVSLKGFTAAYDAVKASNAKLPKPAAKPAGN